MSLLINENFRPFSALFYMFSRKFYMSPEVDRLFR